MPQHLRSPPQQPPAIGQTAASGSASKRGSRAASQTSRTGCRTHSAKHPPGRNPATPSQRRKGAVSPTGADHTTAHGRRAAARRSTTRRPRRSIAICARVRGSSRVRHARHSMRKGRLAAAPGRHAGAQLLPTYERATPTAIAASRSLPLSREAVAQSREKVTVAVMVGRVAHDCPRLEPLSQPQGRLGATDKCYPTDQLMHQVMDRFVRQPHER